MESPANAWLKDESGYGNKWEKCNDEEYDSQHQLWRWQQEERPHTSDNNPPGDQ